METLILVIVLSTIMFNGKRIFPGTKDVRLPEDVVRDLEKYNAVERVQETETDIKNESPSGQLGAVDSQPDSSSAKSDGLESSGTDAGGTDASTFADMLTGDLMDDLVHAIKLLEEDDYTATGKPKVESLEARIQQAITSADRDKAWELFKASTTITPATETESGAE